ERPIVGVVLEQMSSRRRVGDVVGGDPLDVGALLVRRAEDVPPDAPEAVDPHAYRHPRTSCLDSKRNADVPAGTLAVIFATRPLPVDRRDRAGTPRNTAPR